MALNSVDIKTIYAEDSKLEEKNVNALVKWVENQPHLPKIGDFEAFLFLKKSHYSLAHAQTTIDTFFTLKNVWPEALLETNFANSPQLQEIFDTMIIMVLPKRTPEGNAIIFLKPLNENMINFKVESFVKYVHMVCMLDAYLNGPPNGHVSVYDIEHFPQCFIPEMDYGTLKNFFYYIEEVVPTMLVKEIHFYNTNPNRDEIVGIYESVVPKSLLRMVFTHESLDDLRKYLPKECLPEECGGLLEPAAVLHEKSKRELVKNGAFFESHDQLVVDESKRPVGNMIAQNMFGFKK